MRGVYEPGKPLVRIIILNELFNALFRVCVFVYDKRVFAAVVVHKPSRVVHGIPVRLSYFVIFAAQRDLRAVVENVIDRGHYRCEFRIVFYRIAFIDNRADNGCAHNSEILGFAADGSRFVVHPGTVYHHRAVAVHELGLRRIFIVRVGAVQQGIVLENLGHCVQRGVLTVRFAEINVFGGRFTVLTFKHKPRIVVIIQTRVLRHPRFYEVDIISAVGKRYERREGVKVIPLVVFEVKRKPLKLVGSFWNLVVRSVDNIRVVHYPRDSARPAEHVYRTVYVFKGTEQRRIVFFCDGLILAVYFFVNDFFEIHKQIAIVP